MTKVCGLESFKAISIHSLYIKTNRSPHYSLYLWYNKVKSLYVRANFSFQLKWCHSKISGWIYNDFVYFILYFVWYKQYPWITVRWHLPVMSSLTSNGSILSSLFPFTLFILTVIEWWSDDTCSACYSLPGKVLVPVDLTGFIFCLLNGMIFLGIHSGMVSHCLLCGGLLRHHLYLVGCLLINSLPFC